MEAIKEILIAETKRRIINESIPRIIQCLDCLSEQEVWHKSNDNSNSVGILILHLCGNVRQWILAGACGNKDQRNRDSEFDPKNQITKDELKNQLQILCIDLESYLPRLDAKQLLIVKSVQCYEETIFSMIIHAIEHFSYHTGQIVFYTKFLKDIDTAFYADADLTAKG